MDKKTCQGKKITTKNSDSFQAKPPSKRLAIMLGGVTMNLISAYIFIVISYMIGIRFTTNQVGMVYPNSPAEKAGLQTKDFITAVNGKSTQTFEDVFVQSALSNKKNPLEIEILRNDEKKTLNVVWQGKKYQRANKNARHTSLSTGDGGKIERRFLLLPARI